MQHIEPTKKKALILTVVSGTIALILFVLNYFTNNQPPIISSLIPTEESANFFPFGILGLIFLWLFFAGLVMITLYAFFLPHALELKKPTRTFFQYYFTFILWFTALITFEFITLLVSLALSFEISDTYAILISLLLTLSLNVYAIYLMYRYLSAKQSFQKWLYELVFPLKNRRLIPLILWGVGGYIGFFPLFGIIATINRAVLTAIDKDLPPQPIIELSLQNENQIITILLFFSITLLAPIFEEIIMRGLIFRGLLLQMKTYHALVVSGLIFAAFHFNTLAFVPITVLGILLSWLYLRTGSLLPPMIAHALFNGLNFSFLEMLK